MASPGPNELTYWGLRMHMHQWTGSTSDYGLLPYEAKPFPQQMMTHCQLDSVGKKIKWDFDQNTVFLHQKIAFENVICKMVALFSSINELIKKNVYIYTCITLKLFSSKSPALVLILQWYWFGQSCYQMISRVKNRADRFIFFIQK